LTRALSGAGYGVLDDEVILKGQDWVNELHTWMGLCHAAVIPFSGAAVTESAWVLNEATIFS
jgi:hypothetical protein